MSRPARYALWLLMAVGLRASFIGCNPTAVCLLAFSLSGFFAGTIVFEGTPAALAADESVRREWLEV